MGKKYKFSGETKISEDGVTVIKRIQALKDFGAVVAGDLGGWIEKEENLSHFDNCWVYDNAQVFDDAQVHGDAQVSGNAWVFDNARVSDDAQVYDNARVYGDAWVSDNAWVSDDAQVSDNACVYDDAQVSGNACVYGDARVYGNARVYGDAQIEAFSDIVVIDNIGSRNGTTTFYKNKHNEVSVVCGCFKGTLEEFGKAVLETHGDSKHGRLYELAIKLAKEQIELD